MPGRGCARTHSRRDRDSRRLSAELEIAIGELLQSTLVLKEDDLAVRLTTQLKTDRQLCHRRVSDVHVLFVHAPLAVGATDADTSLADRTEHGVAVRRVKQIARFRLAVRAVERQRR